MNDFKVKHKQYDRLLSNVLQIPFVYHLRSSLLCPDAQRS